MSDTTANVKCINCGIDLGQAISYWRGVGAGPYCCVCFDTGRPIANIPAEIAFLRVRCQELEQENAKLKALLKQVLDEENYCENTDRSWYELDMPFIAVIRQWLEGQ